MQFAPTAADLLPDLKEAILHFGHVRLSADRWLAERIVENWFRDERRIVMAGEPVPVEELLAAGASKWVKIGRVAWDALTPDGRRLGDKAFEATARRAKTRLDKAHLRERMRRTLASGMPFAAMTLVCGGDSVCSAAEARKNELFTEPHRIPPLPLNECDLDQCCCSLRGVTHWELEKRRG